MGQRFRAPFLRSEDAERLFNWVLEAQAEKWTQRASVLQGISLKKRDRERERKKERKNDTGRPSSDEAGSAALFLKGAFIPWVAHFQTWKIQSHVESAQHYSSLTFIGTRMFSAYLFIYKGLCVMYIIFWPRGLLTYLWLFLDKGWSTRKPAFPLSFRSAVPLRKHSYILMEQRCSGLQQRKNVLTQGSYVVNSKATACFSCIPTILANALPGTHWVKTRKLSNKHWLNNAVLFNKTFLSLEGYAWGVVNNHVC